MKNDLEDMGDEEIVDNKNENGDKRESFYINEIDKEAWQKCVDNTYANDNEAVEHDDWKTPRESWRTCSDGYIDACEVDRLNDITGDKVDRLNGFLGAEVDIINVGNLY